MQLNRGNDGHDFTLKNFLLRSRYLLDYKIKEILSFSTFSQEFQLILVIDLGDGILVKNEFDSQGMSWVIIQQHQIEEYTIEEQFENYGNYYFRDVVSFSLLFKTENQIGCDYNIDYVLYMIKKLKLQLSDIQQVNEGLHMINQLKSQMSDVKEINEESKQIEIIDKKKCDIIDFPENIRYYIDHKIVKFIALTKPCQQIFLKVHGAQHCIIVLELENGIRIHSEFDNNGVLWMIITDQQFEKYKIQFTYKNLDNHHVRDAVYLSQLNISEYHVVSNNCFDYVQYMLQKMTTCRNEIKQIQIDSGAMVGLSVATDAAALYVGGPVGWAFLAGKFVINMFKS